MEIYNVHRQRVAAIASSLRVVDLICELVDARCPQTSSSPAVSGLILNKQHLLVLNKSDLADPGITRDWLAFFNGQGKDAAAVDSKSASGFRDLWKILAARTLELHRSLQLKGRRPRGVRVAVLGIPNTGKSTYLNRLIGRQTMRTGDRPGLTRGPQWVHLNESVSVLDTPGIMSISRVGAEGRFRLGAIGSVEVRGSRAEETCERLLAFLKEYYPAVVGSILKIDPSSCSLEEIARARGFLMSTGLPDSQRASDFLLEQFRSGRLGRISLEKPHS
ncbi:MAG: ribosome biogenesis GTPase YlqF [Thermacetogeniaceae bacterium]